MYNLDEQTKNYYLNTKEGAKKEIHKIDDTIDKELQRVKDLVNMLKEKKKSVRLIYDGATEILGLKNEFDDAEI